MKPFATFVVLLAGLTTVSLLAQQPVASQAPPAQDAPPVTFRVEVNYVEVDALVTDALGNLITDLTERDFELLEDGKPQTINAFSLVNIPTERLERPLFSPTAIEPDVQTNDGSEGRLYLIVLDSLHTSPVNAIRVRRMARQFVEEYMAANDVAAVVFTRGTTDGSQDFTSNKRLLLQAIDRFQGVMSPGRTASMMDDLRNRIGRQQGDPVRDPIEFERAYNARTAMDRLRSLSEFMASVRGRRKAMLLFGEGIEYDFTNILASAPATGVLESVRDSIGAATRANVAIYTIDPRGLNFVDGDLTFAPNNPGSDDRTLGDLGSTSANREFRLSQQSLRQIADQTGGFAVVNQNEFSNAFARVVRENSSYYVLGYYPTNERRDGRFRNITVRVKRPGAQVRSRRGYVAPRGRATEAPTRPGTSPLRASAVEAMASPLAVRGIPMRVFAAPMKGAAPNALVAISVEMDINGFTFTEAGGNFNNQLELAITAIDVFGETKANAAHTVNMAMKPDTLARARSRGFRVLSQVDVPPGRYQLRIAAAEGGGKTASVIADVEVPDFYKQRLAMSGLSITSTSALESITVAPKDPLVTFLPAPLTATREFSRNDTLAVFAEFYENVAANTPPHKIDITTSIRADDGRVLSQMEEEIDSSELTQGRGGVGFTSSIPLQSLQPGLYVIHVEARSRASRLEDGVGRDVLIRVR